MVKSAVNAVQGMYPCSTQTMVERGLSGAALLHALEDGQFRLHYQPKVEMRGGKVVGVEALLRWHHPTHGLLRPELFVPVAEQHGVIQAISRWVLETVVSQCAQWRKEGLRVPVAVNLSGMDLEDRTLPHYLAGLLQTCALPSSFIELEITETAAIADLACSLEVLGQLSRLGVGVAIDDFGIGYSSLQRLRQLPVTTIKIDKSFIAQGGCNKHDMVFIDTITHLGHRLGLKVVAEGIESKESWARLAAAGCDMGQGYHISRPLPSDAVNNWMRSSAQQLWRKIG